VNCQGFDPLLKQLADGAGQYFGDASAAILPVARLERPFSSLLRLRVATSRGVFHAFLKVFKPRLATEDELAQLRRWVLREFNATARLHESVSGRHGLSAVRPIAVFPDRLALITEEVVGQPLDEVLRDGLRGRPIPAPLTTIARNIGAWTAMYQQVTPTTGLLSLAERRDYLDVRLRALTAAGVLPATEYSEVLARFDDLAPRVDDASLRLVAIHADLCPANVFIGDGGAVTVLDFAMAKTGARFHDIAHLYMHLQMHRSHLRGLDIGRGSRGAGTLAAMNDALLAGFDEGTTAGDPLFRLMLLQHVVCHVAQLAQGSGVLQPARRWRARRRWLRCSRFEGLAPAAA